MSEGAMIRMELERQDAASVIRELQEEMARQKERIAELEATVAALQATVKELREENARLRREGKRSAGPFSKNQRKQPRKRPGRIRGKGQFHRLAQPPESADTTQVEVAVPDRCACGGALEWLRDEEASITEPPRGLRPHVTKFRVPVCRCRRCGATVRGRHADLAPDQFGATAHRYGDRMMAMGHVLHYGMGIPQQKVPAMVEMFTGVAPTQSAFNQDATRRSEEDLAPDYEALRSSMKEGAVGHTDATGWKVDGEAAQLAVYTNGEATVYDIQAHYRNEEIREVFPDAYRGTLVGDGAKAFDANALSDVKQQKCLFHGLKLIGEAQEKQPEGERGFGEELKNMLQAGLALWHAYHAGNKRGYWGKVAELDKRITEHLRERDLSDADNQRLLKFFGEHHQKGALTRFLWEPRVPPTNNLAELELRYLIPARKVSGCSKSRRGADAQRTLGSLIRTEKRKLEKEQRQSSKPYADQRSFQAEQRQAMASQTAAPPASAPRRWLDRVTELLRTARERAQQARAAVACALAAPVTSP